MLFSPECTINREGFMNILGNIWTEWTTADAIVCAAKQVGVSAHGLSVEWMQKDKFMQAASVIADSAIEGEVPQPSTSTLDT